MKKKGNEEKHNLSFDSSKSQIKSRLYPYKHGDIELYKAMTNRSIINSFQHIENKTSPIEASSSCMSQDT